MTPPPPPAAMIAGILPMLLVLLLVVSYMVRRRQNRILLVLRRVRLDESDPSGIFVEMAGRPSGFFSWLFTTVRLLEETSLIVTAKQIAIKSCGLSGEEHSVIPLPSVASTRCAYRRPIWLLIFGVFSVVVGVVGGLIAGNYYSRMTSAFGGSNPTGGFIIGGLIVGIVLSVAYILLKSLSIQIETDGGSNFIIVFQRTVIENVSVDMKLALRVIRIINENATKAQFQVAGPPISSSAGRVES